MLQTSKTGRKFSDVQMALTELEQACGTFKRLCCGDGKTSKDTAERAKRHATFCADSVAKARPHLEHAERRAAQERERAAARKAKEDEILAKQKAAEEAKVCVLLLEFQPDAAVNLSLFHR